MSSDPPLHKHLTELGIEPQLFLLSVVERRGVLHLYSIFSPHCLRDPHSASLGSPARKWARLLYGREFHMDDVLVLWDCIFADSSALELVDYIAVAMLIYIRADRLPRGNWHVCVGGDIPTRANSHAIAVQ